MAVAVVDGRQIVYDDRGGLVEFDGENWQYRLNYDDGNQWVIHESDDGRLICTGHPDDYCADMSNVIDMNLDAQCVWSRNRVVLPIVKHGELKISIVVDLLLPAAWNDQDPMKAPYHLVTRRWERIDEVNGDPVRHSQHLGMITAEDGRTGIMALFHADLENQINDFMGNGGGTPKCPAITHSFDEDRRYQTDFFNWFREGKPLFLYHYFSIAERKACLYCARYMEWSMDNPQA